MRILVVDDDPVQRRLLEMQFAKVNVDVLVARSGQTGWAAVQTSGPLDAVVTDLLMINGDGMELLQHVNTLPEDTRPYLVVCTAFGDVETQEFMLAAGADECLQKPALMADIRLLIDHIEAKRRRRTSA